MSPLSRALIESVCDLPAHTALVVALSGGRDSVALLHAAKAFATTYQRGLRAVHINHQLQSAAGEFESFCQALCAQWNVPLRVHRVCVDREQESSVEAAARQARYRVFAQDIHPHEVLLTAQHQSDQAETFLLQALRGAGVAGLAAMPFYHALGHGAMMRPWLHYSRHHIEQYVQYYRLDYVDDPSNDDTGFKRNALRLDVLPTLAHHFPAFEKTIARAAHHCAQADLLLQELAAIDAQCCVDHERDSLKLSDWRMLSQARQINLLRVWINQHGVRSLSEARLLDLHASLLRSTSARLQLAWDDVVLRCYRGQIFVLPQWPTHLSWQINNDTISAQNWAMLKLSGWHPSHTITIQPLPEKIAEVSKTRKTFQQWLGVPEWLRPQIPAIYLDGQLSFYGTLWRSKKLSASIQLISDGTLPTIWRRCCGA